MKHSYYDFVSFIMFNINYSNIYRLGKLLVNSSNLLWLTPHIVRELTYQYIVFINSEILILIPCKLPFIGPWCDLSGATKKTSHWKINSAHVEEEIKKSIQLHSYIIFYHKCNAAISSEKTYKPRHRATKVTVCVNPKPIQDSFSGFKLIVV